MCKTCNHRWIWIRLFFCAQFGFPWMATSVYQEQTDFVQEQDISITIDQTINQKNVVKVMFSRIWTPWTDYLFFNIRPVQRCRWDNKTINLQQMWGIVSCILFMLYNISKYLVLTFISMLNDSVVATGVYLLQLGTTEMRKKWDVCLLSYFHDQLQKKRCGLFRML